MTGARKQLVLEEIHLTRLPREDMTPDEVKYCMDNELVTTNRIGIMTHAFHIAPNQSVNFDDVPKYPPIDGLTPKGEQELRRITERLYGRRQ